MQERLGEIRALGAELVAITQSKPETLAALLAVESRPFPFFCDPQRVVYRAFGLERGTWGMFFRPGVLLEYLRRMFRGWRPRRSEPGEDLLQLGGDFILAADGHLVLAHRSADPGDRPSIEELLRGLRTTVEVRGA